MLRGALLAAMRSAGGEPLTDDMLTQRMLSHLRLEPPDYSANPLAKGIKAQDTLKALRDVLGYRLYFDLQRGWRINNTQHRAARVAEDQLPGARGVLRGRRGVARNASVTRIDHAGQPALVVTYRAARSPHDQYFFADPTRAVAGEVNPPSIDLANEDLIRSHLQAVWLGETGVQLGSSVRDVLDRERSEKLPLHEEIAVQIGSGLAVGEATRRAERILATLEEDLAGRAAPWYTTTWLPGAMKSAERRLDESFDRRRSLFRATASQIRVAKQTSEQPSSPPSEASP